MVSQRTVRVRSYTRTIHLITIEFVCQRCQRLQVVTMYPGPRPKWCLTCFPDVRKAQARDRKRRQRAQPKQTVEAKARPNTG